MQTWKSTYECKSIENLIEFEIEAYFRVFTKETVLLLNQYCNMQYDQSISPGKKNGACFTKGSVEWIINFTDVILILRLLSISITFYQKEQFQRILSVPSGLFLTVVAQFCLTDGRTDTTIMTTRL